MTNLDQMDTLSTVMKHLKRNGHDNEFTVDDKGGVLLMGNLYHQNDILLIKTYRFEGESDPSEEAIIYLIKANDGVIGYSIDTYGLYTNHLNDVYANVINKLRADH